MATAILSYYVNLFVFVTLLISIYTNFTNLKVF